MVTEIIPSVPQASSSQTHQAEQSSGGLSTKNIRCPSESFQSPLVTVRRSKPERCISTGRDDSVLESSQPPLITVRCSKRKRVISTRIADSVHELPPSVIDISLNSDQTQVRRSNINAYQTERIKEEDDRNEVKIKDELVENIRKDEDDQRSHWIQTKGVGKGTFILPARSGGFTSFQAIAAGNSSNSPPQFETNASFACVFCKCELSEVGDMALLTLDVPLPVSQICPLSLLRTVDVAFSLEAGRISEDNKSVHLCSHCLSLMSQVDEAYGNLKNLTSQMKKLWCVYSDVEIPKTNLHTKKISSDLEKLKQLQRNSNVTIQPVKSDLKNSYINKKSRLEVEINKRRRNQLKQLSTNKESGDCALCGEDMRSADKWLWRMHLSGYHRTGFICNDALSSWCLSTLVTEDLNTIGMVNKCKGLKSEYDKTECVACGRYVMNEDFLKHLQVYHKMVINKSILPRDTGRATRLRKHEKIEDDDEITDDELGDEDAERSDDAAMMKDDEKSAEIMKKNEKQSSVQSNCEDTIIVSNRKEMKSHQTGTEKTLSRSSLQTHRRRKTVRQAACMRRCMCKYCPQKFPTPEARNVHYTIQHSAEDTNPSMSWQCKICFKRFPTYSPYRLHKAYVHSKELYVCEICGATYKMKSYLTDHQKRNHWSKNPYNKGGVLCEECGKTFKRKSDLTEHHKQVHRKKVPQKCSHCRKSYQSRLQLRRHLMRKHNIPWEETLTPRFTRNLQERKLLERGTGRNQKKAKQKTDDIQASEDEDFDLEHIEIFEIDSLQDKGMITGEEEENKEEEGKESPNTVSDQLLEKELEAEILTTLDNSQFLTLEDEQEFNVLHVSESPAVTNMDIVFAGDC